MKKKQFFLCLAQFSILALGNVVVGIVDSVAVLDFFMLLYLMCVFIFFYLLYKRYDTKLEEKEVIPYGGERFSYSEIKGIAIYNAVNRYGVGPKDKNGNPKAMVSFYSSPTSFIRGVRADSQGDIPMEDYYLGSIILDKEVLSTLFEKTELPVFITEEMMKLYYESYADIFEKYQFRVLIGCAQEMDDGEREFISLAEFKKYHNR